MAKLSSNFHWPVGIEAASFSHCLIEISLPQKEEVQSPLIFKEQLQKTEFSRWPGSLSFWALNLLKLGAVHPWGTPAAFTVVWMVRATGYGPCPVGSCFGRDPVILTGHQAETCELSHAQGCSLLSCLLTSTLCLLLDLSGSRGIVLFEVISKRFIENF